MTATSTTLPPPSTVSLMTAVADLLTRSPALDDPDVVVKFHRAGTGVDLHITSDFGPVSLRRDHIAALAMTLRARVSYDPMARFGDDRHFANLGTHGVWAGARISAWTELSRVEARALGLAVCGDCAHRDHGDDVVCLASIVNAEGFETHCECGPDPTEPVVADLTADQRLHLELVRERTLEDADDEACDGDDTEDAS